MSQSENRDNRLAQVSFRLQQMREYANSFSNNPPQELRQALSKLRLHRFETQNIISTLINFPTWHAGESVIRRTWQEALDTQEILTPLIVQSHNHVFPENTITNDSISLNSELPGSIGWHRSYTCQRLIARCSRMFEKSVTGSSEDNDEEEEMCMICYENFIAGEYVIQLPCHQTHRIHENCLILMKEKSVQQLRCPKCRSLL
ncbi:hypothetical protein CROQUDRAFT_93587 [Cronartium quercuum f. sp. fusiforme G11]|uniref:RING-type domain-containing protein n=1 Tax=Cronartium quercuum f. sp. fusiforme G11 TaxID=708437 RepID=A0A9P6NGL8_9BASI|nr:hypothetical protein CROQUDRAFT_93587 [Cronartium quercuum f. sp. fusiforme G11]